MLTTCARADVEERVRTLCEQDDFDAAATSAIRGYGPEVFGLLCALHRDDDDAGDAFALFTEGLWRGLPTFRWQCSLRTWAYVVARHASSRFRKNARRHAANVPLSEASGVARAMQEVRTETASFLRTAPRDRMRELRDALTAEDQMLLVLRVDRELPWDELARVFGREGADRVRESARLRQRFQAIRERLVTLGRKAGLIKKTGA